MTIIDNNEVLAGNPTIIQKANFALSQLVSDGGLLYPLQAQKFMRLATIEAELLKLTTYRPMKRVKEDIDQIKFGSRVLRPYGEFVAMPEADRATPDLSKVQLETKKFAGEVELSEDVLDQNIEQGELRQTLMQLLAPAAGRDLEEVVINGDTASPDTFLAQFDGVLKQATSNVVDAVGAPLSKDLFNQAMRTLPQRYRKNKRELRFFTASNAELFYRNVLADRESAAGDKYLETDTPILAAGVPVVGLSQVPDDLGGGSDQTVVLLTHPKNIIVGVHREVKLDWEEIKRTSSIRIYVKLSACVAYSEESAAVKIINVAI
ncbi:MAG: phage major capsid protein [Deltaproteobacteria bacterium]|nr:phage major capsid protein [Deltaproteobacteria bacterium]